MAENPSNTVGSSPKVMVVPRHPGPLLGLPGSGARDDLDAAIEEVFGETTAEGPGRFDAFLLIVGIALVAWAWISQTDGIALPTGILAILLGIALPARSLVRARRARQMARYTNRALTTGYLLDVSDAINARLATAYESLLDVTTESGDLTADARTSAHQAMIEVATLLGGRPATVDAEVAYVNNRIRALRATTAAFKRARRVAHGQADRDMSGDGEAESVTSRSAAVAEARLELEADNGLGSVDQLGLVRTALKEERTRGAE